MTGQINQVVNLIHNLQPKKLHFDPRITIMWFLMNELSMLRRKLHMQCAGMFNLSPAPSVPSLKKESQYHLVLSQVLQRMQVIQQDIDSLNQKTSSLHLPKELRLMS